MKFSLSLAILLFALAAAKADQAIINSGPQDLTINAGSTADLVVTATGATSYQWVFQGTNITGATNAELNFSDVSTNQAGLYTVVVAGSTGTNVNGSANLTVLQGTILNFQIAGFASGPSNVVVELFDHDKPMTVQNFVHYVYSGAYSNMFFDRLIPGFVLQGGSYATTNQTVSIPVTTSNTVRNIYDYYVTEQQVQYPYLPPEVPSEFYAGPIVSNQQGTLAMALPSGNVNGAANAFFFNLVDNPFLDVYTNGGGPYTVFGRVLSGADVLAYFNNPNQFSQPAFTTTPTNNIFTNGIYDEIYLPAASQVFGNLPVNFYGTDVPADSNLFYVNFSFPDTNALPVIDTNPPTATITFPPAGMILTNGISLTVQGTAHDDVGVAVVGCYMVSYNGAYGDNAFGTNIVNGTTNWSLTFGTLEPGIYQIDVVPQDAAGNGPGDTSNSLYVQSLTITAVLTNGQGYVAATNLVSGAYTTNAIGANLTANTNYTFGAQAAPGWFFVNWTYGGNVSYSSTLTLQFTSNMVLTANFASNNLAFTNPPIGGNTTNGTFSVAGIVNPSLLTPPITVTCRLYSRTNQQLVGAVRQVKATNTWSFPYTDLGLGEYEAVVTAQDALGQTVVITNNFSAGLLMTVLTNGGNGRGTVSPGYNGKFLVEGERYSMTASPAGGSLFENWSIGVTNSTNIIYTNNRVVNFTMTPGLVFTAAFVSNDFPSSISSPLLITYPASGAKLTTQTFNLAGTINANITNSPVVRYQLYYGSNSVTSPSASNVAITPAAAPARSTWAAGLTNLPPGYYTVIVTVSDASGHSTLVSESFQILAQVVLQVSPPGFGTITTNKANWTGQYVSPGQSYTVTAKTNGGYVFAYWSNSVTGGTSANNAISFVPTTNTTLTAYFDTNYFYNVAGTYVGLFTNGVISPTNSGYFSVIITSNGVMNNLTLKFPALTLTSPGYFPLYDPAGYVSVGFAWKGLDGKPVTNYFTLDLTNGTYSIIGGVYNAEFYSSLVAFRATPKLTAGSVVLPGTNIFSIPGDQPATNALPGGDSYATFTLASNGVINLIGYLADNTSFSESTWIAANPFDTNSTWPQVASYNYGVPTNLFSTNAIWPFYASLYNGKGIAIGWETNTSPTNFAGAVAWSKPARTGSYETNAFLFLTNSYSSTFLPPVAGTHYQIVFGGASFTNELTNTLTVSAKGQFTNNSGLPNTNKLTLTLTTNGTTSGALSGSFSYPSGKVTHNFYGGFISPSPALGGSGYFLDTNSQTGFFQIQIVQ
jgi:cyclophilin family peptidyl-prolyl cis-trans isomerase